MEIPPNAIQFILEKLAVLNEDYTQMAVDVGILKSQMAQVLMYQKLVLGAFLSIVGGIIIYIFRRIFIKVFNNKGVKK